MLLPSFPFSKQPSRSGILLPSSPAIPAGVPRQVLDAGWYRCWRCGEGDARGEANAAPLFLSPAQLAATARACPFSPLFLFFFLPCLFHERC